MAENLAQCAAWRKEWFAGLSDDEKAALQEYRDGWGNEAKKNEYMEEFKATFATNDTN